MPLSPERFALQLTIGEATRSKLLRAQALLRHQVPSGDLAEVLDRALDALLDKVRVHEVRRGSRSTVNVGLLVAGGCGGDDVDAVPDAD